MKTKSHIFPPLALSFILLFFLFGSVSFAAEKTEKQAQKLLNKVRKNLISLTAEFEQYEMDANDQQSEKSHGNVWLKAPNQFKWEYTKPGPQLIMADGKQVWIYDEDLEQVTIKQQKSKQNPIYVLLNKKETEANYTLSLIKAEKNQTIQWISMHPKQPSDEVKVVWLGIEGNNLSVLKLHNQMDSVVVFKFTKTQRNPELTEDYFTFQIPDGVDVIRDTAHIGEF